MPLAGCVRARRRRVQPGRFRVIQLRRNACHARIGLSGRSHGAAKGAGHGACDGLPLNIRNGTGVLTRSDGSLAWFHLSTVDKGDVFTLSEGDPVDVEIEDLTQGEYECRAVSMRRARE